MSTALALPPPPPRPEHLNTAASSLAHTPPLSSKPLPPYQSRLSRLLSTKKRKRIAVFAVAASIMVLITAVVLGAVLGSRAAHAQSSSSASSTSSAVNPQGSNEAPFPDTVYPGFQNAQAAAGAVAGQTSPPKYPSPWMDGSGGWASAYQKAQALVRQMTLTEKVNLTTGVG